MKKRYTKVQELAGIIYKRKADGETNREIAESLGLTLKQVKQLITRENRKRRLVANGYILQPKGRPRKTPHMADTNGNRVHLPVGKVNRGHGFF